MSYITDENASYLQRLYQYRHYGLYLVGSDLRARFRRTYLGMFWAMLQPLFQTILFSIALFHLMGLPMSEYKQYTVYVFSGVVLWDILVGCINVGAGSLEAAGGNLRQARIPAALFPLRAVLHSLAVNACGLAGLIVWTMIVYPQAFSWHWVLLPVVYVLILFFATPLAIIASIVSIKLRDFQQAIGLITQGLWFISPVFISREVFNHPNLAPMTYVNPITSLCDIFRGVFMYHQLPTLHDLTIVGLYGAVFWALAVLFLKKEEPKLAYYL